MANILVVDDERMIRDIVRDMLEKHDHGVTEAVNGKHALQLCQENEYDLIITDLVMPEQSGIDFIMQMTQEKPGLKILAISGNGNVAGRPDYLPVAKLVGADSILEKPFRELEFIRKVDTLLSVA